MKIIKLVVLSLLVFSMSLRVNASAVIGATEPTQILNNVQLALSYYEQYKQYKNMIDRLKNMELNTLINEESFLQEALPEIDALVALLNQGNNLSYAAGNIQQQFEEKHTGFKEWMAKEDEEFDAQLIHDMSEKWGEDLESSIVAALSHTQMDYQNMKTEQDVLKQFKEQSATAEGRLQAIQTLTDVALEQVQQTQKMRLAINNQTNLQGNYYKVMLEQDEWARANNARNVESVNEDVQQVRLNDGKTLSEILAPNTGDQVSY